MASSKTIKVQMTIKREFTRQEVYDAVRSRWPDDAAPSEKQMDAIWARLSERSLGYTDISDAVWDDNEDDLCDMIKDGLGLVISDEGLLKDEEDTAAPPPPPRGYRLSLAWHDIIAANPLVPDTPREDGIIRLITAFQPEPTGPPLLPIGAGPAVVIHLSKTQTEQMFKGMNKRGFYLEAFHGNAKQLKQHAGGRIGHAYVFDNRRGLPQNTLFDAPPVYGPVFIQYGPKTWDALDDAVKRSSTLYLIEMMERNGAV